MAGQFYPPPPVFVGGRQPYAPALGIAQSGPTPDNPPRRSLATLGIVLASWVQASYPPPVAAKIAPLIPAAVVSGPPPAIRAYDSVIVSSWAQRWTLPPQSADFAPLAPVISSPPFRDLRAHHIVQQVWRYDPTTIIYVCSIAPLLAEVVTPDNPPPNTDVVFNSIIQQWSIPYRLLPKNVGVASLLAPAVVPDNPPVPGRVLARLIRGTWEPPWYALPKAGNSAPFLSVAATPDAPPPNTNVVFNSIVQQWVYVPRPLPALKGLAPLIPVADNPPVRAYVHMTMVIDQWRPVPSWRLLPSLTLQPQSAPFFETPSSSQTVTVHGYGAFSITVNG